MQIIVFSLKSKMLPSLIQVFIFLPILLYASYEERVYLSTSRLFFTFRHDIFSVCYPMALSNLYFSRYDCLLHLHIPSITCHQYKSSFGFHLYFACYMPSIFLLFVTPSSLLAFSYLSKALLISLFNASPVAPDTVW